MKEKKRAVALENKTENNNNNKNNIMAVGTGKGTNKVEFLFNAIKRLD